MLALRDDKITSLQFKARSIKYIDSLCADISTRPRGYKTFFMLNSVEHEILNAHKYKNIKNFSFF